MTKIQTTLAAAAISLACGTAMAAQLPPADLQCPGDVIVWVTARSHVYHLAGDRWFGNTAAGAFACQHAADAAGDRAAKSRHPAAVKPAVAGAAP